MKAVTIHEIGGADQLCYEDIPAPTPEDAEVLVEVHAAGVNPIDAKVRSGASKMPDMIFPFILGWDVSGLVVESRSEKFQPDDEVFGMVNFPGQGATYAEVLTAPAAHLEHKPTSLNHNAAAGLPLVALTALQAFRLGNVSTGQRVLIHAAAGGVGHVAVQIAKILGAEVIATCSADNVDFVRGLGADKVIDYKTEAFDILVEGVDFVLQTIGGDHGQRSLKTMNPDGHMVLLNKNSEVMSEGQIVQAMRVQANSDQLTAIADWIDKGQLASTISHTFALEDAASAHQQIETGHTRGKVVLQIK